MKKTLGFVLFCSLVSANVFAADTCTNDAVIQAAAEKAIPKKEQPNAGAVTYAGTTRNGKDKWMVEMSVNEECLTTVVVYTKEGTCKVTGAVEIGQRDCG